MKLSFTTDQRKKDNHRFGGNTLDVFKRDGFKCVNCSMTMAAHLTKYGKRLTINHINGMGRRSVEPDNRLINLETVCLPCHGMRDCQNEKWQQSLACKSS